LIKFIVFAAIGS